MPKIALALGTRPEIIKMSPIVKKLNELKAPYFIIHTGQHYSFNMDQLFFKELELSQPKYNLGVGSATHAILTAEILRKIEPILLDESPDVILVQGDTDSVLASALAAAKLNIKIGHIEAGLRSYDRQMPEEINRVLVDHMSDYLFCPTSATAKIARLEGIEKEKIFVTGNTVVDAVTTNLKLTAKKQKIFSKFKIKPGQYILITSHRQENVDRKEKLKNIIKGIKKVAFALNVTAIWPIHPRTEKKLKEYKINLPNSIKAIEPIGYLEFLLLAAKAKLILTDSGGIQEEACILKVPCVTLRENTERPETIEAGVNLLAGTDSRKILFSAQKMLSKKTNWKNPFGDGKAGERIVKIILEKCKSKKNTAN